MLQILHTKSLFLAKRVIQILLNDLITSQKNLAIASNESIQQRRKNKTGCENTQMRKIFNVLSVYGGEIWMAEDTSTTQATYDHKEPQDPNTGQQSTRLLQSSPRKAAAKTERRWLGQAVNPILCR